MSTTQLSRFSGFFLFVLGCTGLDPGAFGSGRAPADAPEVAGFSFDAGPERDGGGKSGSSTGARGGGPASGGRSDQAGNGGTDEGGGAGTPDDGGTNGGGVGGYGGSVPAAGSGGHSGARGGASSGGRAGGGTGGSRAGSGGRGGGAGGTAGGASGRAGSDGGPSAVHALYFSEYVEGSSSYKALEIQARAASTLSGCRLATYFNGAASGSGIALDGALEKGGVTTLCSTALAALLGAPCDRATNLTFNGDDAVALECNGATLDVIGQIGVDPGDAWSSGDTSSLNQTLRRRCGAPAGDPNGADAFEPALEWLAFPTDTFDGLGLAECAVD